jgi:electron transfer flavoprotein alpha subunit
VSAVVVCTRGTEGTSGDVEGLLTLGRRVAGAAGKELRWALLGPAPDGAPEVAGLHGVAGIDRIDDPKIEGLPPDACVEALAQYCSRRQPTMVLFGQEHDTRLLAPRLAGRLGSAVVMNAVDAEVGGHGEIVVTAAAYGGDTRVLYELSGPPPHVLAVMPNSVASEPATEASSPAVHDESVDLSKVEERVRVVEPARAEGPRLEDAQVIVSGGRGLGSAENYGLIRDLAEALGGVPGASRPIVDDGWTDSARQVGLTGRITRPALYIAAGISGASQHMVGCSAAKTIVAINRDPDAAIFRHARYGIVADCLEILPELIRIAKQSQEIDG